MKLDSNSVLAFDEYDRQCANHFLARKVALRGKAESHRLLEQTHRQEDAVVLRIIAEGWGVLADAQSALAHSCIVMLNVKSAKLQFIFDCQKAQALALQQKFEETWTTLETFSLVEAKSAIRDLRLRLRDYLLTVHTEILVERPRQSRSKTKAAAASTPSRARTRSLSVSSPGGPGGRQSGPSSLNRAVRSGSCALDDISSKDLPLLQFLQRHTTTSSSISASATSAEYSQNFQVEVASTVFGDAFGGSWRVYAPFLPAAALEKSEHSPPRVRPLIGSNLHFKLDLPSPAPPPSAETAAGIRRPPPRSAVLPLMFSHRSSPAGTTRPSAPAGPRGDWSPTATTASSSSAFTVEALMEQMRDLEELGFAHRTTAPATDEEHDEEDDQDEDSEEPLQEMVKRARK